MHIRPATKQDAPRIRALIRAVNINPLGLNWRRFLVVKDESGHLIGCGQVKPHRDGSWELASIAVQPKWQGQGVAGKIIQHLTSSHPTPLWLTCMHSLVPFYQKFGFVEVTAVQQMPPYFRMALRLFTLYQKIVRLNGRLAVMHKPSP